MNPVTALLFILAGTGLWLKSGGRTSEAKLLAGGVLAVGLVRLVGYVMDIDVGIDQWLFPTKLENDQPSFPNRMSPNAALNFVLFGCGLLLMDGTSAVRRRTAEFFALLVGFISLLALLGYAYQVNWLYGVTYFIPMALHTAALFHLIAFGMLCLCPSEGKIAFILGDSPGGALVRHLFPVVVPGLVLLGWLRLEGERNGYFAADMGTTLYTIVALCMVSALIWWSALSLHRTDKARQHVEAELKRFFTLSLDALCIIGRDGYFKRVNPVFMQALGYTEDEILTRPVMDFIHPDDREKTEHELARVAAGVSVEHFENRYRCKDGTWRWLWWKGQFLETEKLIYGTGRDVTELKKTQEEIRELNSTLQERATQLDASNQELEAFSYSVSHDLRAPLRGISGFTQALEEHAGKSLDETGRSYLARVRRAAERMGFLIDDLLKLSRLTRAEMKLETVDLSPMAESILTQLSQNEPQRQVQWKVTPGILVNADAALMRVLLENLLENAWKFTSKNPAALIEVGILETDGSAMGGYVRDNGVGFDMRYASKLFGAFQRLHSMIEFPGTGIGLATVQRVVRRHGGRVWADAELNVGSTFYFEVGNDKSKTPV
ncbi:sensor histidine kinase [Prosthecobacter fusiformis]|nr:PAS domain S-box protein [Prosthecobacter fusiformis]